MAAQKYRSAYSGQVKTKQEPGKRIQPTYSYIINKKGQREIAKTGEKNIYEEIQANLEETKIENILKRVSIGDMTDFRPDGIYQDITEVPNNMIQARREMQKLENLWNILPPETKSEYGWSVEAFMADAGSENWLINTGFIKQEKMEEKEQTTNKTKEKTEAPQQE